MTTTSRSFIIAAVVVACSGTPSKPSAPEALDAAVASEHATSPVDEPRGRPEAVPPAQSIRAAPVVECEPHVTDVLFVPHGDGHSVTILGEGFCRGGAPASARFGEVPVDAIVVASSGKTMTGKVARMPRAGATLWIHTPPGDPVLTTWVVPGGL